MFQSVANHRIWYLQGFFLHNYEWWIARAEKRGRGGLLAQPGISRIRFTSRNECCYLKVFFIILHRPLLRLSASQQRILNAIRPHAPFSASHCRRISPSVCISSQSNFTFLCVITTPPALLLPVLHLPILLPEAQVETCNKPHYMQGVATAAANLRSGA